MTLDMDNPSDRKVLGELVRAAADSSIIDHLIPIADTGDNVKPLFRELTISQKPRLWSTT
jgi:hypothetical protein